MKIISGGSFIYFVEIWLNKLLGLTVFGVRCSDCYVINICCDLYVFSGKWNVRGVNVDYFCNKRSFKLKMLCFNSFILLSCLFTGCSIFSITTSNNCIWEMIRTIGVIQVTYCYRMNLNSLQIQFIQYAFHSNQLQAEDALNMTCKSHKSRPGAFSTIPSVVSSSVPPNFYDVLLRPCSRVTPRYQNREESNRVIKGAIPLWK